MFINAPAIPIIMNIIPTIQEGKISIHIPTMSPIKLRILGIKSPVAKLRQIIIIAIVVDIAFGATNRMILVINANEKIPFKLGHDDYDGFSLDNIYYNHLLINKENAEYHIVFSRGI